MNEHDNGTVGMEELWAQGDNFDLGSTETDEDPFGDAGNVFSPFQEEPMAAAQQTETVTPPPRAEAVSKRTESNPVVDFNPLTAAINKAEEQDVKASASSLFGKPPVFVYGGATEDITDKAMTFELLRIEKSKDFPELEDGKKVTWTMEYGKIIKQIPKPKETVISKLKAEIETSKEFLEAIKKSKDKVGEMTCQVKPRIIAQSKGIASYKGVFTSLEEAKVSGKPIQILPAQDGKVYEIRCTDAGRFITPAVNVSELSEVRAGFFPALPPIPFPLICQVIGFFRHFMGERELEAMVHIYWDKAEEEYRIAVPKQQVGKAHIDARIDIEDVLDESRFVCFADIHSHNSMPAKFSAVDDRDERATRVYIVIGRLNQYFPEINARISNGGRFLPIPLKTVVGGIPQDFPEHWLQTVDTGSLSDPLYGEDVTDQ